MCCSWWNSKLWLQNSGLKVLGVCSVMSFLGAFFSIYIGGFWGISWSSLCSHVCVIQCSTKNSHISCNVTIVCNVSLDGKAFLGIQGKLSPAGCVLVRKAFVIWNSWMLPPSPCVSTLRHSRYAVHQRASDKVVTWTWTSVMQLSVWGDGCSG